MPILKTRKSKRRNDVPKTRKYSVLCNPIIKYETKQLRHRSMMRGGLYIPNWKLFKGGIRKEIEVYGYQFVYDDTEQQVICLSSDNKTCFKIDFDISEKTIGISIGYYPTCSVNKDLPESSGTLVMLQAILTLVFQHPDIASFTNIEINDNSHILVSSFEDGNKYKTRLMDMYFLSTGCTWYSSLTPMFLKNKRDDENYTVWRTKILSMSWKSFLENMVSDKMPIDLETRKKYFEFQNYPMNADAHTVLNEIRKERTHSIIFYKFIDHMLVWMNVLSLYGKPWIIPLRNGKIVCPTEGTILTCKNERGWGVPEALIEYVSLTEFNAIKAGLQSSDIELPIDFPEIRQEGKVYNPSTVPVDEIQFNEYVGNSLNSLLFKL